MSNFIHPWFNSRVSQKLDAVSQLCPACGLCCNGVIFGDVELQSADSAARLKQLGLDIFPKGRKQCFAQPCGCFDGKLCRIYAGRPVRCRTFECGLLKRVQSGRITVAVALKAIVAARIAVDAVKKLVRRLGHIDESVPLNRRYAAVVVQPIDLGSSGDVNSHRRKLMLSVAKLTRRLEKDFLS